jgi:phosphoribosylamine--glycine ligase
MLSGEAFGAAGQTVILEEYLTGPEVSVLAFSDGERIIPMPPAQDHKRLLAGDEGPNTGGMGTISPVPACDYETHEDILRQCVQPLIDTMANAGSPFRGILFAGLMLTPDGPKVLEYNARFGDPETQSLLRRLDSDLLEIFLAIADGDLSAVQPRWSMDAACCIVMASGGYPGPYTKGQVITGLEALPPDVLVFHAGTARNASGQLVTNGGRVLGVTATGPRLEAALDTVYAACEQIAFTGRQYRTDIGRVQRTGN